MKKYNYNTKDFDFANFVKNKFNIENLSQIHTILKDKYDVFTDPSQDQKTFFHKKFYELYEDNGSQFLNLYDKFILYIASTHFQDKKIIYQSKPTFRVQIPDNIAVAKWHKDKLYNHSEHEINIFLPLTEAFDTNTIWAETEEDKGDFQPMNAKFGEYYIWNGANLNHGNKKNETGVSRVSLDFRIIEEQHFNYSGTSVTTKVPMKIGHYWKTI
jgi:ectoine hydroxylase-related dioxygenase (phytanoyl-CoA dioxygenase family)